MKTIKRFILMSCLVASLAFVCSGCFRQEYLIFEDGEFDGMEFSDYDLMNNAELELDDVDRN